jgi:hypothetical protein
VDFKNAREEEFAWKSAEEDVTPNTTELLRYSAQFSGIC